MRNFALLSSAIVLGVSFAPSANAGTKLIYNQDTGARVGMTEYYQVLAESETTADTSIQTIAPNNDGTPSDGIDGDARGGVLVKNDPQISPENVGDNQELLKAKEETADGDTNTRIQEIEGRANEGVQATATTKIDVH